MMENPMSKEANALLLNLLASRINAAGAHCPPEDPPECGEPDEKETEKDQDKDKDKDGEGTKIRFL
jgi:hypothetical protein